MINSNGIIDSDIITRKMKSSNITSLAKASIRQLVTLINEIEQESGQKYIRMEMGVPGLPAPQIGIEAEIDALHRGVASKYPMIEGIPELKKEISRFCSMFLDISVDKTNCFPTVGSAQGALATFLVANRIRSQGGTLFIDPGFPNQKRQLDMIGQPWGSFDVYKHRGSKLKAALEKHLGTGKYTTLLYSNPNNPAWICFNDEELASIAEIADKYDVIVIEDLAYFGMDYRADYSIPGHPPYQPTIAKHTDNYVLLISSSKVFSYAGQRIGSMVISNTLYQREFSLLKEYYGQTQYGKAITFGALHGLSSGVTHSTQYGLAAMLKAANDNTLPFLNLTKIYAKRAKIMKKLFLDNGFELIYAEDNGTPLSDGFYFTISYPNMDGDTLLKNLISFGISALSLANTGSEYVNGARACVSQVKEEQIQTLTERLEAFSKKFSVV